MAKKTVAIIGSGFFGIWTANKLAKAGKYTVKLITPSDYTYFLISSIRVPVEKQVDTKGTFHKLVDVVHPSVEIVKDEVVMMREGSVELQSGGVVEYDALVVATGSKWSEPIGSTHQFRDDFESFFKAEQKKIAEAKHIVLVGGGFNNTELGGELHDRFKDELKAGTKKITIVQSSEYMLPDNGFYTEKLRRRATEFFQKETDIELLLNTRAEIQDNMLTLSTGEVIEADLVYHSTGASPSVPPFEFQDFTDHKGFIKVHETFQCVGVPEGNVFAIGDVVDFPLKGLVMGKAWMAALIPNIQNVLESSEVSRAELKTVQRRTGPIRALVSLGAHAGCGQFPVFGYTVLVPEWLVRFQKSGSLLKPFAAWVFKYGPF